MLYFLINKRQWSPWLQINLQQQVCHEVCSAVGRESRTIRHYQIYNHRTVLGMVAGYAEPWLYFRDPWVVQLSDDACKGALAEAKTKQLLGFIVK
jgi:hypothetical protein